MNQESTDPSNATSLSGEAFTDNVFGEPTNPFEQAQARRREQHQHRSRQRRDGAAPHVNPDVADRGRTGGRPQYDDYAADAYFNKARQRVFDQHFGPGTAEAVLRLGVQIGFLDLDRESGAVHAVYVGARSEDRGVHDCGDALKARRDTPEEIALMVELAVAKGWTTIHFKGSPEFCALARARAEAVGLTVGRVTETAPNPYAFKPTAPTPPPGPSAESSAPPVPPAATDGVASSAAASDVLEAVAEPRRHGHGLDDLDSALDLEEDDDGVFRSPRSVPRSSSGLNG